MKILVYCLTIVLGTGATTATAVENGTLATGDSYVVSVVNFDLSGACSGVLVSPSVVITATHCVLDKNGLISKTIYVGTPGQSNKTAVSKTNSVVQVVTSDSYNSNAASVTDNDLAFLVLSNQLPMAISKMVHLASEAETAKLKSSKAPLKFVGYGVTSDTSEESEFPYSFLGTYSTLTNSNYPNSGYINSTMSNSCKGDSGGPVFYTTPTRITLVGILTGGARSKNCTKKESDGTYLSLFTETSKYANLAFEANIYASFNDSMRSKAEYVKDDETIAELRNQVFDLQTEMRNLEKRSAKLNSCLNSLKKVVGSAGKRIPKGC